MKRIDERDVMFARMARKPGTAAYEEYYGRNPEKQLSDDELRKVPPMGDETAMFYDPLDSLLVDATFGFLGDIKGLVDGPSASAVKVEESAEVFTARLKEIAALYGAKLTGVAAYDERYYYSHRGRMDAHYGERLDAVTTDLPLVVDAPAAFQVSEFCETCGVCARFCPSKAINAGTRGKIDGELRWQIDQEKCYGKWQALGSDCGLCLVKCPVGVR